MYGYRTWGLIIAVVVLGLKLFSIIDLSWASTILFLIIFIYIDQKPNSDEVVSVEYGLALANDASLARNRIQDLEYKAEDLKDKLNELKDQFKDCEMQDFKYKVENLEHEVQDIKYEIENGTCSQIAKEDKCP